MYIYKTVPAPKLLVASNNKKMAQEIAKYSDLINSGCIDGWEFYSIETISVQEKPGCINIFSRNVVTVNYNMLIFRKEK